MHTSSSELTLEKIKPPGRDSVRGILAMFDGSASGTNTAWRAALVARAHAAPLHLVNIQPKATDALAARTGLQELAGQLERGVEVRVKTIAVAGEIREAMQELAADKSMVVVPWQAGASWTDKVLGTLPERMLRWLDVPVLIVRRQASAGYRRVLVPVKLEPGAEWQIALARRLVRGQGLRMLHVLEPGAEGMMRLANVSERAVRLHQQRRLERTYKEMNGLIDRTGAYASGASALIAAGHAPSRIMDAARTHRSQLIVTGRGRRSAISSVLFGGLVQDLIREAEADLLVLPMTEGKAA